MRKRFEEAEQLGLELRGDRAAAEAVDGDEDGVAVAVPAEGRGRALDAGMAAGDLGVVGGRDGAFLAAVGVGARPGAPPPCSRARRRRGPGAGCGPPMMPPMPRDHVADRVGADVADGAVADAIVGGEGSARGRAEAVAVVAEAEPGAAVASRSRPRSARRRRTLLQQVAARRSSARAALGGMPSSATAGRRLSSALDAWPRRPRRAGRRVVGGGLGERALGAAAARKRGGTGLRLGAAAGSVAVGGTSKRCGSGTVPRVVAADRQAVVGERAMLPRAWLTGREPAAEARRAGREMQNGEGQGILLGPADLGDRRRRIGQRVRQARGHSRQPRAHGAALAAGRRRRPGRCGGRGAPRTPARRRRRGWRSRRRGWRGWRPWAGSIRLAPVVEVDGVGRLGNSGLSCSGSNTSGPLR